MSKPRIVFDSCPAVGEIAIGAPDLATLDEGELRRREVETLAMTGGLASVTAIIEFLGDPDWRVRRAAASALAARDDADPSALLCERLASEDAGERNAAIKALIKRGPASVKALLESLKSPDEDVRNFACVALGQIGHPSATGALIELVGTESDANVRYMALEGLARIGDPRAVDTLIAVLDEDMWFAAPATEALGAIGGADAIAALSSRLMDESLALVAIEAMGATRDPRALLPLLDAGAQAGPLLAEPILNAIGRVLESIDDDVRPTLDMLRPAAMRIMSADVRSALERALGTPGEARIRGLRVAAWIGDPALAPGVCLAAEDPEATPLAVAFLTRDLDAVMPYLETGLKNPYPAVRLAIAEAIGVVGDARARHLIEPLLSDPNQAVCLAAIDGLAVIGDSEDAGLVVPLLASDLEETRSAAAAAVAALGIATVAERIADLAAAHSPDVRRAVARAAALAPCPGENPLIRDALLSLARDADARVRAEVAPALASLPTADGVSTLLTLALDEHHRVRLAAIRALRRDAGQAATRALRVACRDESPAVRAAAIRGLSRPLSAEDVPLALDLLADPDPGTVLAALRGLDALDSPDAVPALVRLIDHPADDVREAVLRTLMRIAPEQARELAAVVLSSKEAAWNVRLAAVEALVGCDGSRGGRVLIERALADPEAIVRTAAVAAVRPAFGPQAVAVLIDLLDDPVLVTAAGAEIARIGDPVVPLLAERAANSHGTRRRTLLLALGGIGSIESCATLDRLLRSEDRDERWCAIVAISHSRCAPRPDRSDLAASESDPTAAALLEALAGGDVS